MILSVDDFLQPGLIDLGLDCFDVFIIKAINHNRILTSGKEIGSEFYYYCPPERILELYPILGNHKNINLSSKLDKLVKKNILLVPPASAKEDRHWYCLSDLVYDKLFDTESF